MESKFSTFFVLIFIAVITISTWYLKNEINRELLFNQKITTGSPDFFLKNFFSKQTKENGDLKFTLSGKKMENFKHLNLTKINQPEYFEYKNKKKNVKINGDLGEIKNNGDKIIIKNNVILSRLPDKNNKLLTLYTNKITILTNDEIVYTDLPVKIIQEPNIEISGTGMQYEKKEAKFKLLKNAKVYYEKPQK